MKKYILALLLIPHFYIYVSETTNFFSIKSENYSAVGLFLPHPDARDIDHQGWHYFHQTAFILPEVLEHCRLHHKKFVFVIPHCYSNIATISPHAPLLEGVRVGLAWTSAYFRFKELSNVDVRILLTDPTDDLQKIRSKIANLLHLPFNAPDTNPEAAIKKRLIKIDDIEEKYTHNEAFIPFYPTSIEQKKTIITPDFNTIKKRILLTGGAGFIGSHLARTFINKGYQVIVLDNLCCSSGDNIASLCSNPDFNFYQLDITNPFDINGPLDIVAHLASIPSPDFYYAMPLQTMRSGLHGTKEMLELALRKNARFFFSSTSEVYGDPEINPQPETYPGLVDPLGKRSQYDQSKRGAETLIKLYYDRYGLDVRIARIFNTYGPGMQIHDGRVMTNFISAALDNKPMTIYGSGNQTRSPIYVDDMVRGLTQLIESDIITTFPDIQQRIFNIGNPEELSINQVATIVNEIALKHKKRTVPINHIPQFDATDPKVRKPDIRYINQILGFTPLISFTEGIEKMFLHYTNKMQK